MVGSSMEEKIEKVKRGIEEFNKPFIGGRFISTGKYMEKVSPIDGKVFTTLEIGDENEIDLAVKEAKEALKIWKNFSIEERKEILWNLSALIEKNLEELAILDSIETGRCISNFINDSIPKAIKALRWFIEAVDKYLGHSYMPNKNTISIITKEPLGVVGCITPWNDPLVVNVWKFAPSLLVGNTVVIKPAEQASLSILKVAQLTKEAGLPDGVFNVVPGYGEVAGKALAMHEEVRGIFFTGSSEVGKLILQYAGLSNMKKVSIESGGKSPFIVTRNNTSERLKEIAKILADNMFYNAGQICSAPSRLIIDKKVREEFLEYLVEYSKDYIPSHPLDPKTKVGALVSKEQYERVKGYIHIALKEGGEDVCKFELPSDLPEGGFYVQPHIFVNLRDDCKCVQEEIFGPVLVVQEFTDIKEAVGKANGTKYGLAGAVFSQDIDEALYIARNVEAGLVHINTYGKEDNVVPFGGYKQSGIGRDKSFMVFDEHTETKTIWIEHKFYD